MTANTIPANSIRMNYRDSATDKTPLIFIHGFPFDQTMWDQQITALNDVARVISYDIRGFGKSERGQEKATIPLYADDLIALMDALSIRKAHVCGLSMGGYILLNAVDRFEDRFLSIILADTQCLADSEEGKQKRKESIRSIDENGLEAFAEKFLKGAFSPTAPTEAVERVREIILRTDPEVVKGALLALAERRESCSHLKNIKVPALILCGEQDELTTLPQSEFLFNNIPGAKMHAIEKAGHLSNLEQAEVFNQHLTSFLTGK